MTLQGCIKLSINNRRWIRRWTLRAAMTVIIMPLLLWLTFLAAVQWWPYPPALDRPAPSAARIEDRNGTLLASFAAEDGQWRLPLAEEQISPHLMQAVVAVEDSRFYTHHGVDWKSIAAAASQDVWRLSVRRGASTLTMQLQRLRDPRPRTLPNKLEQAIRAEQLERQYSKNQLLIEYLNRAPFGGSLVGAGAASWRYFGKPCRSLSLGEAALLAGLPQSPNRLRPDRYPARAMARRRHVLERMLACGFITAHQRDEAAAEPVNAIWRPLPQDRTPRDMPSADGALPALLALARKHSGETFRTTIDAGMQRQAVLAAAEHLQSLQSSGVSAAAVVILDTQSAQCLASVSIGPSDCSIDLTRRRRSTGSTLKPFIYAAAFDAGIYAPRSVLSDSPAAWPGYEPNDYDRSFRGSVTAADALAESRNIPAMLVLQKVGIDSAVGVMDAAGMNGLAQSPRRYGLSLAIGGAEASPMELAEGYAALGRGGMIRPVQLTQMNEPGNGDSDKAARRPLIAPNATLEQFSCCSIVRLWLAATRSEALRSASRLNRFNRATNAKNALNVADPALPPPSCLRSAACWQVLSALSDTARTSGVCPAAARSHVAWKTGTSSGHHDAWCAAVTRRRTVVVWLGNVGGESSPSLIGQDAAAPLALRLIAMLDPADEPWPVAEDSAPAGFPHPFTTPAELVLVRPTDGQQFVMTSDSPVERQQVLLEATHHQNASGGDAALWWFVDGMPLGSSPASQRLWWKPQAGTHQIRVIDSDGHSASARIGVRVAAR
jgi:penicillin-binding protein 1C